MSRSTAFKAGTRKAKRTAVKSRQRPAFAHREPFAPAPVRPKTVTEWLSVAEAATVLGVSATTVRRRANAGDLPFRHALSGKGMQVQVTRTT